MVDRIEMMKLLGSIAEDEDQLLKDIHSFMINWIKENGDKMVFDEWMRLLD